MNPNSKSQKLQIVLLITVHLLLLQMAQLADSATILGRDPTVGNYLDKPAFEPTVAKQHQQEQASDTNRTDKQTENSHQTTGKFLGDEKHQQQAAELDAQSSAEMRVNNQAQSNMTPTTASKLNKPAYSAKAEKLIKGLSSFMNPSLNPAAYFVPAAAPLPASKSQHLKEPSGRKSVTQKTDSSENNALSGGQQSSAEPPPVASLRATGEGIVSAQTRMARPQNYVFRWGRR